MSATGRWSVRAVIAAAFAVLVAAFGASAASAYECPTSITGEGSSLQRNAQGIWGGAFTGVCTGGNTVTYNSTSSGAGLAAWGATGGALNTGDQFIGTDDAPDTTQIRSILTAASGSNVGVIPVAQAAIAIIARPPSNCTVTFIGNRNLEEIYAGTITRWSQVTGATPTVERGCEFEITAIVRRDLSGTSYQLKHYLSLIGHSTEWRNLQALAENTRWIGSVTRAGIEGGSGIVRAVNETSNSIGYANLADASGRGPTILRVQSNGTVSPTLVNTRSPQATNDANCANASYTGPNGIEGDWSNVYGSTTTPTSPSYSICTLTWDLGLEGYAAAGFTANQATSASNYLQYLVSATGQERIAGRLYAVLPAAVQTQAQNIAALLR